MDIRLSVMFYEAVATVMRGVDPEPGIASIPELGTPARAACYPAPEA